jgi:hypothetical protein
MRLSNITLRNKVKEKFVVRNDIDVNEHERLLTTNFSFILCLSVILDSLSCSFTSISFLTTNFSFILFLSVILDSFSCSFTSISFLTTNFSFTLIYI